VGAPAAPVAYGEGWFTPPGPVVFVLMTCPVLGSTTFPVFGSITPVVVVHPLEPLAVGGAVGLLSLSELKHPVTPPHSTARAPTQTARPARTRFRCAILSSSPERGAVRRSPAPGRSSVPPVGGLVRSRLGRQIPTAGGGIKPTRREGE